jgi:hypothetical protein
MSTEITNAANANITGILGLHDRAEIVSELINNAGVTDLAFDRNPQLWMAIRRRLSDCTSINGSERNLDFQRSFRRLIELQTFVSYEKREVSGYLQALFHMMGKEWIESELREVPDDPIPTGSVEEVENWFRRVIASHPAPEHPLYDYLENEADKEDFCFFVQQEITVDAGFADLLAYAQIGQLPWKQEVARNYWDEMGEGKRQKEHGVMFSEVLAELGIEKIKEADLTAESLACGNLLFWLSFSRPHHLMALGALAATEYAVPNRFRKIVNAARRLGIANEVEAYYNAHVEGDEDHSEGWLKSVIYPALNASPLSASEISKGVYLRLNTSKRYCDALLSALRQRHSAEKSWPEH